MLKLSRDFNGFNSIEEYHEYITQKRREKGRKPTKHDLSIQVDSLSSWYQDHLKEEAQKIPIHNYKISTVGNCVCIECLKASSYFISQLTITYDRPATQEELADAARSWGRHQ